ncbi:dentin sialophosphoprotein isoform X2 [Wyeomyia smithii]|uniref:dentin sialophosphoprotein isoform X2 n=1 Tax=Wyeomyia smithii TaxID=174621 RepID=UPI00246800D8|nr:dentin sialophosphoprotein isoform X2 [Wyeomyia smithii]
MKNLLITTAVICSGLLVTVLAVPVPEAKPKPAPAPAPEPKTDIELMKIPLDDDKELDVITLVDSEDQRINERNKRTIGILRELFPTLSQILDQKIQMITSYLFRTIGPILLRSGLGGGAGNNGGSRGTSDVDFDDDFGDDDDDTATKSNGSNGSTNGSKVSISLPTFPPSSDDDSSTTEISRTTTASDENDLRKRSAETVTSWAGIVNSLATSRLSSSSSSSLPAAAPTTQSETVAPSTVVNNGSSSAELASATTTLRAQDSTDSNLITSDQDSQNTLETLDLAGLSDTLNAIRVARATAEETKSVSDGDDQKGAESSGKSSALDELSLDSEGNDEDRNKRFLSFGGSSAGGAGGSGNFLFDIIRLISGSSGTEQSDEKANSPDDDHDLGKGDGYTEGIPGPVTRLFVLANRGLSNLIQDLILRIAQTSERVVNFKARLITSLI